MDFIVNSSTGVDTVTLQTPLPANEWIYLGTPFLNQGQNETLKLISQLPDSVTSASIPIDVVKFTAMVRDREIRVSTNVIDYGEVSLDHETFRDVKIRNQGLETLTIQNIESSHNLITLAISTPLVIEGMQEMLLSLRLYPSSIGLLNDTLTIYSDDPLHPTTQLIITADVQYPFQIIDNEDTDLYVENGVWFTSVAQALGNSSRYAWLNSGASASFTLNPENEGIYKLLEIVPRTVNATDNALYILKINEIAIDSVYLNQNLGSGQWMEIGTYYLPFDAAIQLEVHDTGNSTVGAVLRADGIKIQMLDPTNLGDDQYLTQSPSEARLYQNYPNPFNPSTTIRYSLPENDNVELLIYDLRGTLIRTLSSGQQSAGIHKILWDGTNQAGEKISTGVYFCRIQAGEYSRTVKMLYLK